MYCTCIEIVGGALIESSNTIFLLKIHLFIETVKNGEANYGVVLDALRKIDHLEVLQEIDSVMERKECA